MMFRGLLVGLCAAFAAASNLNIGVGISDMTGPTSEVNLMGYANPVQVAGGLHMRLFARAFVFQDSETEKHFAFVSIDAGMGSDLLNTKVIDRLNSQLGEGTYSYDNLCISGTHSHSGPAGFLQYTLFQVTSLGFMNQTFTAFADGIADAVVQAHENLVPGTVRLAQGEVQDSNINRSPTSYLLNPEEERDLYDADTDLNMLLLRLDDMEGNQLGVVNWFAVHGTSLNNTNRLLSGDNRGYASYLLERDVNGGVTNGVLPGHGPFVAAFASTNLGDVSPNTAGPRCIHSGDPCDPYTSTCHGRNEACIAFGPGTNGEMFESAEIIGRRQYDRAAQLVDDAASAEPLSGPVDYRHLFVNMSSVTVEKDGETYTTCRPAMGYSFAAGTTDGPGMFNFHQAMNETTPFWNAVADVLSTPSDHEIACQAPKPILLDLSGIPIPYQWDAEVVPIQILRVGSLFIASVPSEFTTMAGRRLRSAIEYSLRDNGVEGDIYVTIAGLANSYADYVTTYEEYQAQRYEAASTIFGPHTHEAYVQLFEQLAADIAQNVTTPETTSTPDLSSRQWQVIPDEVSYDSLPRGVSYGDIVSDVSSTYKAGDVVDVTFWGANPRSNLRHGDTYLSVDRLVNGTWSMVASDGDFETRFIYHRVIRSKSSDEYVVDSGEVGSISERLASRLHHSQLTIEWHMGNTTSSGDYRIQYFGDATQEAGGTQSFVGVSSTFTVAA